MREVPSTRRLTTILAADVVGYSKLMAADEDATFETLRTFRSAINKLVEKHNGRIFNTAGDAFLAEFSSAVEAVRCAISIQEDLAIHNAELQPDRRMLFRIGINVGDVIVENGDLFGDGVNVAARLEGLADDGGICISGTTFHQVKNKLSFAFDDLGEQSVKNLPEPVSAFRIVPGDVRLNTFNHAAKSPTDPVFVRNAIAIIGCLGVLGLTGAYLGGYFGLNISKPASYDGRWMVDVRDLTGCIDNSSRSYPIVVTDGVIDMATQKFPKKGTVTKSGEVSIKATDKAGNLMNSQTGIIDGNSGEGTFHGRKAGCAGKITMTKLD